MSIIRKLLDRNPSIIDKELSYVEAIRDLSKANRELSEKLQILQDKRQISLPDVEEVKDYKPLDKVVTFSDLRDSAEELSRKAADEEVAHRNAASSSRIVH